jgi:hypothetical protein
MKYLLQADWERLVKNSERYEVLIACLMSKAGRGTVELVKDDGDTREAVDKVVDQELERQADASRRANGDTDCKTCGLPYRRHPKGGPIGCDGEQFLNRLCDGSLVKL